MGVKIIFKDKIEPKKEKGGKVAFGKKSTETVTKTIDGFTVSPVVDLSDEKGVTKFLVHRHKKGVWYKVVAYDEYGEKGATLKLESPHGAVFDSTLKITDVKFYGMASRHDDKAVPTDKVLDYVHRME